jgi:hypothetical protein
MTTNVASSDSSLRGSSLEPKIMYFVLFNNKMLYFALRAFVFLITNINIKITIFYSPPRLSFSILSLLFHFSFIQLPAVFAPYFSPFPSLPLSLISPQVFDLLRHLLHLLSLFSFRPIPVSLSSSPLLHLAIIFLSYTHSLPSLLYFDSLIVSLLSYLSVSLSLYLFIHLLLVHFLAGLSFSSLLLLENVLQFLLSLIPSKPLPVYLYFPVSYFHPFSSIFLFSGQLS